MFFLVLGVKVGTSSYGHQDHSWTMFVLYTVKTGLFSITVPQTVPLQFTVLSSKYLGKVLFVN